MWHQTKKFVMGLGLGLTVSTGAWAAGNALDGPSPLAATTDCAGGTVVYLEFCTQFDAQVLQLTPFDKGKITVWTADSFIFGPDIWRAELHKVGKNGKSVPGKGTLDVYEGKVVKGGVKVNDLWQAVISPDDIPGGYPAGMYVCIQGPVSVSANPIQPPYSCP